MTDQDSVINRLQVELDAVKAKLAKTEASKLKLKEHWALLKEKVINAHTLCDERDALVKQLEVESSARAQAERQLQEALAQKALAEKQLMATNQEQHELARQLNAAAAEQKHLENQLLQAQQVAAHAKQQHEASQSTITGMMQHIEQLQHAVQKLEQQQLHLKISKLEHHWKQLLDREYILTVDPRELHKAVQPPMQQLLQQQVEPRLSALQDSLLTLQQQTEVQQQKHLQTTAMQLPQQQRSVPEFTPHEVQQMLQSMVTEQRLLRAALSDTQHQLAALQRNSGMHWQPDLQDTGFATAASTRPSRETSPAAMGSVAGGHAAGARVQLPGPGKAQRSTAEAAFGVQVSKGSSMFGTTILDIGGLSSSHSYGDQDYNSPSEASTHLQQIKELSQQVGRKRAHLQQPPAAQRHSAPTQVAASGGNNLVQSATVSSAGCSSAVAAGGASFGRRQQNKYALRQQQLQQHQPADSDNTWGMSSSSDGVEDCKTDDDDSQHSPKRRRMLKTHQRVFESHDRSQQAGHYTEMQLQQDGAAAPWHHPQESLNSHLQAVKEQQADAAAAAQQVAKLVLDGNMKLDDIVGAVCDSFLTVAAAQYDAGQVQQAMASLLCEEKHQPQELQLLGLLGWMAVRHAGAKVLVYQQRLAAYVNQLSSLLSSKNQAECIGQGPLDKQNRQQQLLDWPASAGCWQQLLLELPGSSGGSWRDAAGRSAASAAECDSNLLCRVLHKLLQPVYAACWAYDQTHSKISGACAGNSVQQQVPLPKACAAVSAAARLLRCSGDTLQYQCMLLKLTWAAASAWHHSTSTSTNTGTKDAGLSSLEGMQYCLACLLAAVGAWPEVVQLIGLQEQAAVVAGAAVHCSGIAGDKSDDFSWQWAVLDPVRLALSSCIAALAQAVTPAGEREGAKLLHNVQAADHISSSRSVSFANTGLGTNSSHSSTSVGRALLLLLNCRQAHIAAVSSENNSRYPEGVINDQSQVQAAAVLSEVPRPAALLSMLLGMLKVLLQKQHVALPAGQLIGSDALMLAYAASVCAAVRLCAHVVGDQQAAGMLRELSAHMTDNSGLGSVVFQTVQNSLDPVLVD